MRPDETCALLRCSPPGRVSATLLLLIVSACNGRQEHRDQVPLAMVNDRPVSVVQMTNSPAAAAPAVESLVDEELLVQSAEKAHLDRDPAVELAMESARRQILAHAFAERAVYPKKPIASTEAQQFYKANPILFENRKRFRVKTYAFEGIELSAQLNAELEGVHSDPDLRELLDKHDIKYTVQANTLAADQLPLNKLDDFERATAGDILTARPADGMAILMLVTAVEDDEAVSFDRAKPYIEAYLTNTRNRDAVSAYLSRLKASTRIDYMAGIKPAHHAIADRDRGFSSLATAPGGLP